MIIFPDIPSQTLIFLIFRPKHTHFTNFLSQTTSLMSYFTTQIYLFSHIFVSNYLPPFHRSEIKWFPLGSYTLYENALASRKTICRIVICDSNGTIDIDPRVNEDEEQAGPSKVHIPSIPPSYTLYTIFIYPLYRPTPSYTLSTVPHSHIPYTPSPSHTLHIGCRRYSTTHTRSNESSYNSWTGANRDTP